MAKTWLVPYYTINRGTTEVEAETAEEARAKVERGDFENHPGEERSDWGATGPAREDRRPTPSTENAGRARR